MDMYARIQRQPARRQHITPGAAVLAAFGFLVAATCIGILVHAARYQLRYRRFINNFSASLAASNKMSLRMTWQDEDVPITTDQASRLCRRITTAGAGKVQKNVPDGDECQLVFGDGASLTMWQADIPEKMRPTLPALLSAMPMLTGEFINMIPTNCCLRKSLQF